MNDEKMPPERAIRLLRAKVAELEDQVRWGDVRGKDDLAALVADVALIASILADFMEQMKNSTLNRLADMAEITPQFTHDPWGHVIDSERVERAEKRERKDG